MQQLITVKRHTLWWNRCALQYTRLVIDSVCYQYTRLAIDSVCYQYTRLAIDSVCCKGCKPGDNTHLQSLPQYILDAMEATSERTSIESATGTDTRRQTNFFRDIYISTFPCLTYSVPLPHIHPLHTLSIWNEIAPATATQLGQ